MRKTFKRRNRRRKRKTLHQRGGVLGRLSASCINRNCPEKLIDLFLDGVRVNTEIQAKELFDKLHPLLRIKPGVIVICEDPSSVPIGGELGEYYMKNMKIYTKKQKSISITDFFKDIHTNHTISDGSMTHDQYVTGYISHIFRFLKSGRIPTNSEISFPPLRPLR
jgi:hypothetical protein